MKANKLILPLLLALGSSPLYAGHGHHNKHRGHDTTVVKARVSQVEPIVEVVQIPQEHRECWDEEVSSSRRHRSGSGLLTGAIIGGVIGHNVGNEQNRGATAAVGTLLGASIGNRAERKRHAPYSYTEQHCSVTTDYIEEERISGYRVSYLYHGESYTTRMDRDPGKFVRLRVSHQLLD